MNGKFLPPHLKSLNRRRKLYVRWEVEGSYRADLNELLLVHETSWDKIRGELRIQGRRHIAVDAEALCAHLDSLMGARVGEVVMESHEYRLGREDAERIRRERPYASAQEVINRLFEAERLSGVGVGRLSFPAGPNGPVLYEVVNPCVKKTQGAAKSFLASYWCGVLSILLDRDYDANGISYDEGADTLICRLVPR